MDVELTDPVFSRHIAEDIPLGSRMVCVQVSAVELCLKILQTPMVGARAAGAEITNTK